MTPAEKLQLAKDYAEQVSFQSTIELDDELRNQLLALGQLDPKFDSSEPETGCAEQCLPFVARQALGRDGG